MGKLRLKSKHKLMCGDSTNKETVELLMNGEKADMVFTSPPYDNQRTYNIGEIDWTNLMISVHSNLETNISEPGNILINLGQTHSKGFVDFYWNDWLQKFKPFGLYIWDKQRCMPGDYSGRLATQHEYIFHFKYGKNQSANKTVKSKKESHAGHRVRNKDGSIRPFSSSKTIGQSHKIPNSVIGIMNECSAKSGHPAVFPVELPEFIIKTWSSTIVLDPFGGSGSTLIACEKTDRKCFTMELDPHYCQVIIDRWEQYAEAQAVKVE